jgi:hypothetical protein
MVDLVPFNPKLPPREDIGLWPKLTLHTTAKPSIIVTDLVSVLHYNLSAQSNLVMIYFKAGSCSL